jgi:hypothetical protein
MDNKFMDNKIMDNKIMDNKFMDWASHYNRIIIERRNKTSHDDCVVCLDTLFNKKVAYLPCKHYFHYDCLKLTIESNKYTCPLCRYDLIYPLQQLGYRYVDEQTIPNLTGVEGVGSYGIGSYGIGSHGIGSYGIGSMRIIHEAEVVRHYDYFFYEDEMEAHYVDEPISEQEQEQEQQQEQQQEQEQEQEQEPITYDEEEPIEEDDEGDDVDDDIESRMFIARYVIRYI